MNTLELILLHYLAISILAAMLGFSCVYFKWNIQDLIGMWNGKEMQHPDFALLKRMAIAGWNWFWWPRELIRLSVKAYKYAHSLRGS